MRAIVQHGPKDLRFEELPMPEPEPGEVLIRTLANGICGSDLHFWKSAMYGTGVVLGHEMTGEVVGLGDGVTGVDVGARGAVHTGVSCGECDRCQAGMSYHCRRGNSLGSSRPGGLAEFVVAPAENFIAAPANVNPGSLTLSEPVANGLRCVNFPEAREAQTAVIIGAGPLGLSCLAAAKATGVPRIFVIEGRQKRAAAALSLGAERVLHPFDDDVKGILKQAFPLGADLVIEAVGHADTIRSSFLMVRPQGSVVIMGVNDGPIEMDPGIWMVKELKIRSSIGCDLQEHIDAVGLIVSGEIDADALVSRRIALDEVPDTIEALASGADEIKVVVEHG